MNRVIGWRIVHSLALAAALAAAGCGGSRGVSVDGKIVWNGGPLTVESGQTLKLSFRGKDDKGGDAVFPGLVKPDGSFVVTTPDGKGIPPGKYAVRMSLAGGGSDPASLAKMAGVNDQFKTINGKEAEVGTASPQTFTIDVAKGTVTK